MPRGYDTMADYYRAHREEMELVIATGCTPVEARKELRRRASERREQCGTRAVEAPQEQATSGQPGIPAGPSSDDWDAPWMMRD